MNKSVFYKFLASLIAVVVGLLVGVLILLIIGKNPMDLFSALGTTIFGSAKNVGNWFATSVPLILTGLSVGFAYKAGLFNIGAEGQFQVASITALFIGVMQPFAPLPTIIFAITAGTFMGAMWALLPGVLKAYYKINEVVVTIMLNWIAFYCSNYFIQNYFHDGDLVTSTPRLNDAYMLHMDFLTNITDGSRLNTGIFLAGFAVIIYWYLIDKTIFGYEMKAVGNSASAAEYAGINAKKRIIQTMLISGAFAGLAGAIYALSAPGSQSTLAVFRGFGFDGIAVSLLGQLSGIGILLAGLLLGALRDSAALLQASSIPKEISDIIIGVIILFSALGPTIITKITSILGGKDE